MLPAVSRVDGDDVDVDRDGVGGDPQSVLPPPWSRGKVARWIWRVLLLVPANPVGVRSPSYGAGEHPAAPWLVRGVEHGAWGDGGVEGVST